YDCLPFQSPKMSFSSSSRTGHAITLPYSSSDVSAFDLRSLRFSRRMTLVILSENLGLLWIAVEATTLASAPLIYFHRHHRSLEATWKYLLICSVGIGLALLGNFFLAVAASGSSGAGGSLSVRILCER